MPSYKISICYLKFSHMTFEIILTFVNYSGSGQIASRKQQWKKQQPGVNIPVMYLRFMNWSGCKYLFFNNTHISCCECGERVCISHMLVDGLSGFSPGIKGHNPGSTWTGGVRLSQNSPAQENPPSERRADSVLRLLTLNSHCQDNEHL